MKENLSTYVLKHKQQVPSIYANLVRTWKQVKIGMRSILSKGSRKSVVYQPNQFHEEVSSPTDGTTALLKVFGRTVASMRIILPVGFLAHCLSC